MSSPERTHARAVSAVRRLALLRARRAGRLGLLPEGQATRRWDWLWPAWTGPRPFKAALRVQVAQAAQLAVNAAVEALRKALEALLSKEEKEAQALEARLARLRTLSGPVPCRSGPALALHIAANAPNSLHA